MLVFDAHLDLSMNALEYNRDLRLPVAAIRAGEAGLTDLRGREKGAVAFPEMRRGEVGICVATIIAGCMKPSLPVVSWNSPEQAWAMTRAQLAWYQAMEEEGHLKRLTERQDIITHRHDWENDPENTPVGIVISLEGADSLRTLDDLEKTVENDGLIAVGPAHFAAGRYAPGHNMSGRLTEAGRELIRKMDELGLILDVTHLSEEAFWQCLDLFNGTIWASHHNCRALVDHPRQLSDGQIKALAERNAVIGLSFDVWMTVPGWNREKSCRADFGADLSTLAQHIDHIAQLLGTSKHCGIGSDLDGGFGHDQCPSDLDTIADVQKLGPILQEKGYRQDEVEGIFHGNFLNLLSKNW
ncbi:MAG: membrane dipeptidase [Verrucomicrobiales bacterium]|nr:membrane dipeptidase [Verrucomicrobiales bacterium]